jgi:hypothetical protein
LATRALRLRGGERPDGERAVVCSQEIDALVRDLCRLDQECPPTRVEMGSVR